MKIIAEPPAIDTVNKWRSEIRSFHREVMDDHTTSMNRNLDIETIWRQAVRAVLADLQDDGQTIPVVAACPIDLEDLIREELVVDDLLAKLTAAAGPAN